MLFAIVDSSAEAARSAELWTGILSAILGCVGGGIGSVIALWADRRKRKMEQKRDLTRSERMGLDKVDVNKIMEMRYSSVPESKEEVKGTKSAGMGKNDGDGNDSRTERVSPESHERTVFIDAVQGMIRGLKSGIVVITGPNNTGKETLLCRAVASCMPYQEYGAPEGRWRWLSRLYRADRQGNVSFYRVKDMTRKWEKIRSEILEWFSIRAEELMTKEKICVLYLDFHSLPKKRAAQAVENVKELYDDIGRLGQTINFVFAVKITGADLRFEYGDPVRCFRLSTLLPDQMEAIQTSLEAVESKRMDRRRLLEFTEGRIGRLMSILHHNASANKLGSVPDYMCRGWFENDDSKSLEGICIGRGMALVYLLAAMARRMSSRTRLDVRALIMHVAGMAGDRCSFDDYRVVLRNALLSPRTDFSSVRWYNFNMEDHDFWDMFLAGWGEFGKYDFMDDLHCIIRSLQADDKLRPLLFPAALGVSDTLIESSYSRSAETSVLSVIVDRFSALMRQVEKVSGFERTFRVAFSRSFAAWLWRRIGFIENDRIVESVTKVATVCGRKALDEEALVEFMPVLVVVCSNPVNWFGGNRWWNNIDVPKLAAAHGGQEEVPSDVAETFLLIVLFLGISLSHLKRFVEDIEVIKDLGAFIRSVRRRVYRSARPEVQMLVRTIWRISAEAYLLEKGCYHDREYAEKEYLSLAVKLLRARGLWQNTRFSHLIPALVRELKLDSFTFSPVRTLSQLTEGLEISTESTSEIYERCYMQTLGGLLQAYRNFYGTSSVTIIKELYNKLKGEKTGGVHLSKTLLDSTRTFEPEKLRCLIWILSNAVREVFNSCSLDDDTSNSFVHDLVADALALQKDLSDQFRAYCFRYLSRICGYMRQKGVDNRLSDLYLFMEALSIWLNESGIIKELKNKETGLSSRCRSIMSSLPEIFTNVRDALFSANDSHDGTQDSKGGNLWKDLEETFNGRKFGDFVNADMTESMLMKVRSFVMDAPATCREALVSRIPYVKLASSGDVLRRRIRRIAELSFARTLDELSADLSDDEFFNRFFALFMVPSNLRVDVAVAWNAIAALVRLDDAPDAFSRKAYGFVRRMEALGLMRYNYQTDWLYYCGLANNVSLLGVEGHEDWCSSFVAAVPYNRWIRNEYIRLAYRLRGRLKDGVNVARKAILELVTCPKDESTPPDYGWRISMLQDVENILLACLSDEEMHDVLKFFLEASQSYRPTDESVSRFMQKFRRADVGHSVEIVREASGKLTVEAMFSSSFHIGEDKVDAAVKTDTRLLLLDVLPDEDYEVEGSVYDDCHGSIELVREGVVSIGFVGMLQRIRANYLKMDQDYDVHIGVVANAKTLMNIGTAIVRLDIHGANLHMLDYATLQEQLEAIFANRRVGHLRVTDPPDMT